MAEQDTSPAASSVGPYGHEAPDRHQLPARASAVVIGGGVIGASVAYHLARLGWDDVLLLERRQFACGTSWHAAGLIGTVRGNESHARLCEYSMSLLDELESETGQSTGFRQVGSLTIAHSAARFEELKRVAAMNNAFGVTEVDVITPHEAGSLYPYLETQGLLGATWVAHDGVASPVDVVNAFIKGARQRGVRCIEGVEVTGIERSRIGATRRQGERVCAVQTSHGRVACDFVVNAAGMWGRALGTLAGVNVPLYACEHYYAHTEKIPDLPASLPVLRDHDKCAYYREDAGSLLVGAFEPNAVPWGGRGEGEGGIPSDFCFDELPGHAEAQLYPVLEDAMARVPILAQVGWRKFFCGPESFTPDDQFHLGESPELEGFFVACGLNSIGVQSSGGLGKALAEWMHRGHSPIDLWGNDIRRMFAFQGTEGYLRERVSETLGLLYANRYPYRQYETSRNVRHSPVHERLAERGACFGEAAGWERANWFAPDGVAPRYEYDFGRQNWFDYSKSEHVSTREGVGLFDQSSFAKYLVQGRAALAVLQRICSNDVDVDKGRVVYTHWLNQRGGVEADLTVNRLDETEFMVVSGAAVAGKDLDWLNRHIAADEHCVVTDVTAGWAVFGLMGPRSRDVLAALGVTGLSTEDFPFGTSRWIEVDCVAVLAVRISYVGELGWELYVSSDQARHAFDAVLKSGQSLGIRLAGMHALDSLRLEKKFVHYGHDVAEEDTPLEAGLGFVCAMAKPGRFIGYDAIARQRETPLEKRLLQFVLRDPEPLLYHHEPIMAGDKVVGYLTSGGYGHTLDGAVGLGYIKPGHAVTSDYIAGTAFSIDVAGRRVAARASLAALYDPKGARTRG